MRKFRLILLILVLGTFAIISPFLALRATGYRLDVKNIRLVATGTIAVTAFPANAELRIKLNDKKTLHKQGTQLSPTVLFPNLLPDSYSLSANADNTNQWLKNIAVSEGKTTSFPFARLFASEPTLLAKLSRTPNGILVHPEQPIILAWDQRGIFGIRFNTSTELPALQTLLTGNVERAQWIDKNNSLLVHMQNGSYAVVINVAGAQPSIIPLARTFELVLPFDEQTLIARTNDTSLIRIRLQPEMSTEILASRAGILALATHKDQAVYLNQQGALWRFSSKDTTPSQITVSPLIAAENIKKLVLAPDSRTTLALTKDGSAWLLDAKQDRFSLMAEGILDAVFSLDTKKLLLKGKHELSLIALTDRTDQPVRKKGERETLTRLGEIITQAEFLEPEEEYITFLAHGSLYLTELDGRGGRNTHAYENVSTFAIQPKSGQLFVISPQGNISTLHIPLPGFFERFGPQTPQ